MTKVPGADTGSPVLIRRLRLRSFRNFQALDIELPGGLTLVAGSNGQGKTNLIEAMYLLCLGRSFREHRDLRMIQFGEPSAQLKAEAEWARRPHQVKLTLSRSGSKTAEVDGTRLARLSGLVGVLPVVSLTPEDARLAYGDPTTRRRFMDVLLAQTDREYLEALKRYRRALWQRNTALREEQHVVAFAYEPALAEAGALIRLRRSRLVDFLQEWAGGHYQQVSGRQESFGVVYRPSPGGESTQEQSEPVARDILVEALEQQRTTDRARGFTGVGPHRDDLYLDIDGRSLRRYGSHGQARTALASLKLAEVAYYQRSYNRRPILLLDEVTSVLDRQRVVKLVELLARGASQVVVTSPEALTARLLSPLAGHRLTVEQGSVS